LELAFTFALGIYFRFGESGMSIKGSWKRPRQITSAEERLRFDLFFGLITLGTFNRKYAKLKREGLLRRSGRVLK